MPITEQHCRIGLAKLLKAEPAAFMHRNNARLVTSGNNEDHLEWMKEVDWVIEAVIEDPAIKQALYQKLDNICRPDTLIHRIRHIAVETANS